MQIVVGILVVLGFILALGYRKIKPVMPDLFDTAAWSKIS